MAFESDCHSLPLPSPSSSLLSLPFTHTHTHTHACTHARTHTHTKLMALIGEHMSKSHLVNGAVVSRRKKGDRIALWTSKKNKKANLDIWCVQSALVDLLSMNYQLITLSILLSPPLFPSLPPSLHPPPPYPTQQGVHQGAVTCMSSGSNRAT